MLILAIDCEKTRIPSKGADKMRITSKEHKKRNFRQTNAEKNKDLDKAYLRDVNFVWTTWKKSQISTKGHEKSEFRQKAAEKLKFRQMAVEKQDFFSKIAENT